jgi:SAM-dependent methyltransferase
MNDSTLSMRERNRDRGTGSTVWSAVACGALLLLACALPGLAARVPQQLAPFSPTPQAIVEQMLDIARVTRTDVVFDLGCGDGRIVITAAKKFGARGVGVDIDPDRIAEASANAVKAGVEHLVTFKVQDALTTDVSEATVVTLYLGSSANLKLRPVLTRDLAPGARIVSYSFAMGDWTPDEVRQLPDPFDDNPPVIYLWRTDGRIRP